MKNQPSLSSGATAILGSAHQPHRILYGVADVSGIVVCNHTVQYTLHGATAPYNSLRSSARIEDEGIPGLTLARVMRQRW